MRRVTWLMLMFLTVSGWILAEESSGVTIQSIEIQFDGKARTNERALRSYLDIEEGQVFASFGLLNEALELQQQTLQNTRYYKSVNITAEEAESGVYIVRLALKDGLTLVPIPYPLPDSSVGKNGWSFGLEVNYDNFIGSMTDFYFDGYANIAFGEAVKLKKWKLTPKLSSIKLGDLKFSLEYTQQYNTTEVTDPNQPEGAQLLQHYTNHQSFIKFGTNIRFPGDWSYSFGPEVGLKYDFDYHETFEGDVVQSNDEVIEDRLNIIFNHNVGLGIVDWVGPLRSGYAFSLGNTLKLLNSFDNQDQKQDFRFVTNINLNGRGYFLLGKRLNYYTKAEVLYIVNGMDTGLGSRLRGVKNSSMFGDFGFFWQNTLGLEIWGNNSLHIQIHPYFDTGFALETGQPRTFSEVFRYGFGTEIIIMVGSVDLKGRIGYDMVSDYLDFFFGTGFSY